MESRGLLLIGDETSCPEEKSKVFNAIFPLDISGIQFKLSSQDLSTCSEISYLNHQHPTFEN